MTGKDKAAGHNLIEEVEKLGCTYVVDDDGDAEEIAEEQAARPTTTRQAATRTLAALAMVGAIALIAAGGPPPRDADLSLDCYVTSFGTSPSKDPPIPMRVWFGPKPIVEYSKHIADGAAVSDDMIAFEFDENEIFPGYGTGRGIINRRGRGTFTLLMGSGGESRFATGHCEARPGN